MSPADSRPDRTRVARYRATDAEANFFRRPDDGRIAVIEIRRTAVDQDRKPFRITITTYPADRNQFTVTVVESPDGQ